MVTSSSTRNLILSNAATAAVALVLGWPVEVLLWPYLLQSLVIGWYGRRRLLALRLFSTDGFTMNGAPVPPTPESQRKVAAFFTLHYGAFHAAYVAFLVSRTPTFDFWDALGLAAAAASFIANHGASFRENFAADRRGCPNLGALMFLPYARIVPMHLVIVFGASRGGDGVLALLLFTVLKTAADVLMHHVEHAMLQKAGRYAPNPS
jgi:hypothetical protein